MPPRTAAHRPMGAALPGLLAGSLAGRRRRVTGTAVTATDSLAFGPGGHAGLTENFHDGPTLCT